MVWNLTATGGGGINEGINIPFAARFDDAAVHRMTITPSASNRDTWTFSTWMKRSNIGQMNILAAGADDSNMTRLEFNASGNLEYEHIDATVATDRVNSTAVYRDTTGWMHVVCAVDTTDGTEANRVRLYVNGVEVVYSTANYPVQNVDTDVGAAVEHTVGASPQNLEGFDGYMAETIYVDGTQEDPTAFGEFSDDTGEWVPVQYTGTIGTNGWRLDYSNSSNFGEDQSVNGNDLTDTAFATNDQVLDTPSNNIAVLNPMGMAAEDATISQGGLDWTYAPGGNGETPATFHIPATGKWVFEVSGLSSGANIVYIAFLPIQYDYQSTLSAITDGLVYESAAGLIEVDNDGGTAQGSAYGDPAGVLVRFEYDRDGDSLETFYDDVSQGTVTWDGNGEALQIVVGAGGGTGTASFNFGQLGGLTNTPTAGFVILSTSNLPTPEIIKPSEHFGIDLYTGTTETHVRANVYDFPPDFVWIKNRDDATDRHQIIDSVRLATKELNIDGTDDESTASVGLTSFDAFGYSLGSGLEYNTLGETYVAWGLLAGGTAASNTDGSITSSVSANQAAGFSVVTYTGTGSLGTVGHGLGVAPAFIIVKARTTAGTNMGWYCYHVGLDPTAPEDKYILVDTSAGAVDAATPWNDTAPTSSVFTVNTHAGVNTSGDTYVAYCFANVEGMMQCGQYTGNGSTDGPTILCGFRPKFLLIKRVTTTGNWELTDSARDVDNPQTAGLRPDETIPEFGANDRDILANGFKIRNTGGAVNVSSSVYMYLAIAASPFKYARAF
jgi:hypothetical protein